MILEGCDGDIEIDLAVPKGNHASSSLPLVIVCHPHPLYGGNMHNKVVYTLFRFFQSQSHVCLRFNFRGVGSSAGSHDKGNAETEDLIFIAQWLQRKYPSRKIRLAGFSFGSYVATRAVYLWQQCASSPVEDLLLVAPPITHYDFEHIAPDHIPWTIIHGTEDELIPVTQMKPFVDRCADNPPRLILLEDASHFFHRKLVDLKNSLKQIYPPKSEFTNNV